MIRLSTRVIEFLATYHPAPAGKVAPAIKLLAIYSHDTKAWRVEDLGAWINEDDDQYTIDLPADARGHDVETVCDRVLTEAAANESPIAPSSLAH